jgi:ubiquinone/menaquinone biosynthesis C-methylase UbiE
MSDSERLRSNAEWEYWGRSDPLYAVAAWPGKDRGGARPWNESDFLRLGESDFADIVRHWAHYGMRSGTCLEIGCGAGRMTGPLLTVFDRVIALDVAAAQIERARQLLAERAQRVAFCLVAGVDVPADTTSCDAVFSTHVFQHLPSFAAVSRYLAETYRVLKPGASACFHIPVAGAHRSARISTAAQAIHNAKTRILRAVGVRRIMEYHLYNPQTVLATLDHLGFADVELRIVPFTSNGDEHSLFFVRRPVA